jgi:succinyl-CoA synthetase beta subunit
VKLLEYQAKQQFAAAGIAIPAGRLARTPEEAEAAARELLHPADSAPDRREPAGTPPTGRIAVKAQVPIGGRGKAGGIAVVDTPEQARGEAARILAMRIGGYPVRSVWCETGLEIGSELYLGITLDRDRRRLVVIFSAAGGMEIEQVAAEAPEKVVKLWVDPFRGPQPFEIRQLAFDALRRAPSLQDQRGKLAAQLVGLTQSLYGLAMRLDALTCEINPLVLTPDGRLVAADGKLEIDENAEYRHKDIAEQVARDAVGEAGGEGGRSPQLAAATGDDPYEAEAKRRGLTYVHLPGGTIGCIGNGAGLAMNTLDLVKQMGGSPNNFLDIGGGADARKVRDAFDMILQDPDVRGIFINIFGGITRGDEVARGIIQARDELGITKPIVVRMTGTREEEGRKLLQEAGIIPGVSAPDAARKIVELTAQKG